MTIAINNFLLSIILYLGIIENNENILWTIVIIGAPRNLGDRSISNFEGGRRIFLVREQYSDHHRVEV